MYPLRDLTAGERLYIARRRAGLTMLEAATEHGVTDWRYREWEKDRTSEVAAPFAYLETPLTPNEAAILARRRKNWSIRQLGLMMGLSHVTVIKWEASQNLVNPVVQFWVNRGWPKRSGPTAARV